ncbi:MAG: hypothetical protein HQ486_01555 [Acidimicrobiaceae bacterium]|nr:hypothetical protein [Acidimicrobiaceae bacterium]
METFVTAQPYHRAAHGSVGEPDQTQRSLPFIQRYVAGVVFVALGIVAASAKIS